MAEAEREPVGLDAPPIPENGAVDFARSTWLTSHRMVAFRQAASEIARHAQQLLGDWDADWDVTAGSVTVGNPDDLADVEWGVVTLSQFTDRGLVVIDHELSLTILVHLLGDPVREVGDIRALTQVESSVLDLLVEPLLATALGALLVPGESSLHYVESRESALAAVRSTLTFFQLRIDTGSVEGSIGIGLPGLALQGFAEFVDRQHAGGRPRGGGSPVVERALAATTVPVVARFQPFRVGATELEGLAVGDILRTGHPVHHPLTAVVGGQPLHAVEAGQLGERLVVSVVQPPGAVR